MILQYCNDIANDNDNTNLKMWLKPQMTQSGKSIKKQKRNPGQISGAQTQKCEIKYRRTSSSPLPQSG